MPKSWNIGDEVMWTNSTTKGRGIRLSRREGKVIKILPDGLLIVRQFGNNRNTKLHPDHLRAMKEDPLLDLLKALAGETPKPETGKEESRG